MCEHFSRGENTRVCRPIAVDAPHLLCSRGYGYAWPVLGLELGLELVCRPIAVDEPHLHELELRGEGSGTWFVAPLVGTGAR